MDRIPQVTRRNVLITASTVALVGGVGGTVLFAEAASETRDCGSWDDPPGEFSEVNIVEPETETSHLPSAAEEVVFYLHGWNSTDHSIPQAATLERALSQSGYDEPVIAVTWDSNTMTDGEERADQAAERFADWLTAYAQSNPDTTIRVIGHSLGGRVILETLTVLDGAVVLETVVPVGAGVLADTVCVERTYAEGIRQSAVDVYSYYSRNDAVVADVFGLVAGGDGLGAVGSECRSQEPPDNYTDVDVTDVVDRHCDYLRPTVGCVPDIVSNFS